MKPEPLSKTCYNCAWCKVAEHTVYWEGGFHCTRNSNPSCTSSRSGWKPKPKIRCILEGVNPETGAKEVTR